jgi:hypothetical protein
MDRLDDGDADGPDSRSQLHLFCGGKSILPEHVHSKGPRVGGISMGRKSVTPQFGHCDDERIRTSVSRKKLL